MNDFFDLKCEREFSKIKDSYFQHLGVLKNAETSSNLAINFRMRFLILVHCAMPVGTSLTFDNPPSPSSCPHGY